MSAELQTIIALSIVALAATALVWRAWAKRKHPGCGGDCACPSQKISSPPHRR